MDIEQTIRVLAQHDLLAYSHVKRRVGSAAMLAAHNRYDMEANQLFDGPLDESSSAPPLQQEYLSETELQEDPVQTAEIDFAQDVMRRFGLIDGYALLGADIFKGLSLIRYDVIDEASGMFIDFTTLNYEPTDDNDVVRVTKRRRAGTSDQDVVKQELEVTERDLAIVDEAFERLAQINQVLKADAE